MNTADLQAIRTRLIADQSVIIAALESCDTSLLRDRLEARTQKDIEDVEFVVNRYDHMIEAANHIALALDALGGAAK